MKPHFKQNSAEKQRINHAITASEVLIILPDGNTVGPCSIQQALQMAKDQELDLVEVSPNTSPPVCKILDYGKFKYNQNKKNRNTQKKTQVLKEIRMQPKISDHDLDFKTNHVKEFLLQGNKVKVTIRFKGRELAHTELGLVILERILEKLDCPYNVDKVPAMEGRTMYMILSPSSKANPNKSTQKQDTNKSTPKPDTDTPDANKSIPKTDTNTDTPDTNTTDTQTADNTTKEE